VAAKAVCFKIAATTEFKQMMADIVENCRVLAEALKQNGLALAYGGTNSHMCLVNLKRLESAKKAPLSGEIVSRILDLAGITVNKNTIPGDLRPSHPGAIRLGTTWVTQRGLTNDDMIKIADLIAEIIKGIIPFYYGDASNPTCRGKIRNGLIEEVRAEVDKLIDKIDSAASDSSEEKNIHRIIPFPSKEAVVDADKHCAILDCTDLGIFQLYGDRDRLTAFCQQSFTMDMASSEKGDVLSGFMLDENGNVLDQIWLLIQDRDSYGFEKILLICKRPEQTIIRLKGYSDGYTIFDSEDVSAKIEGPIMINDLQISNQHRMEILWIIGPKSEKIIKELIQANLPAKGKFEIAHKPIDSIYVANTCPAQDIPGVLLLAPNETASSLFKSLQSAGVTACINGDMLHKFLLEKGLLEASGQGPVLFEKGYASFFALNKNFFIGQRAFTGKSKSAQKRSFSFTYSEGPTKRTCLYDVHLKLTKKNFMVPFAGWEMPVRYGSIFDEHMAVRNSVGLFDVSHMGTIEIKGRGACRFIDTVSTNYAAWLEPGKSHYSYLLDANGNVIDDIMVYRRHRDLFFVVCNAANHDKVMEYLYGVIKKEIILSNEFESIEIDGNVEVINLKDPAAGDRMRVDVALQGPRSLNVLLSIARNKAQSDAIQTIKRTDFIETELAGIDIILSRTGYTGEESGYELYVHPDKAPNLWNHLMEAGKPFGIQPCGLGARDSLRTEAGLPLYGHELAGPFSINPGGAGYSSFVKLHKPFFVGRKPFIQAEKNRNMEIVRFLVRSPSSPMLHLGDPVVNAHGDFIGAVTSCAKGMEGICGMAWVKSQGMMVGQETFIYPSQRSKQTCSSLSEMKFGDKTVLPIAATVIPRFKVFKAR